MGLNWTRPPLAASVLYRNIEEKCLIIPIRLGRVRFKWLDKTFLVTTTTTTITKLSMILRKYIYDLDHNVYFDSGAKYDKKRAHAQRIPMKFQGNANEDSVRKRFFQVFFVLIPVLLRMRKRKSQNSPKTQNKKITYWSTVMTSRCLVCVRAKRNAKSLASDPELTK